ncbi:mitochondrial transcription rescue factor 1 isoform X1 [Dermacentor albipictus]|uniref:mitochondrial transcription rescue factor 1 isoform X1 n=1 Tax=Dermacentor albipictus TaxID=60249 RepID=UPI0031FE04E9
MLALGAVRVMTRWSVRRCILLATAARPSTAKSLVTDRCALLLRDHTTYLLTARNVPCLQPLRSKSKKAKSKSPAAQDEEEDEDEEEEEAESQEYGDNERVAFVSSLRIDSIMKAGINMSKTKVLESFYNGSIRLNGQKVPKKSIQVCIGDEVDHVLGFSAQNPNLMEVDRVTLLATHHDRVTDKGRFQVRLRCQRRLVIEKYADED